MKLNFAKIAISATIVIILSGAYFFSGNSTSNETIGTPQAYEYYWSDKCPNCEKVSEFLEKSENSRIEIEKYQINKPRTNQTRFVKRAQDCQIPRNQWTIPFLITPKGACLKGHEAIIQHFKEVKFE